MVQTFRIAKRGRDPARASGLVIDTGRSPPQNRAAIRGPIEQHVLTERRLPSREDLGQQGLPEKGWTGIKVGTPGSLRIGAPVPAAGKKSKAQGSVRRSIGLRERLKDDLQAGQTVDEVSVSQGPAVPALSWRMPSVRGRWSPEYHEQMQENVLSQIP